MYETTGCKVTDAGALALYPKRPMGLRAWARGYRRRRIARWAVLREQPSTLHVNVSAFSENIRHDLGDDLMDRLERARRRASNR